MEREAVIGRLSGSEFYARGKFGFDPNALFIFSGRGILYFCLVLRLFKLAENPPLSSRGLA